VSYAQPFSADQFPSLAFASPTYAAREGYPRVLPNESLRSYLDRLYPGLHWQDGAGPMAQFSADMEGFQSSLTTTVLDAATFGGSAALGLDDQIRTDIARTQAAQRAGGGGGQTYHTTPVDIARTALAIAEAQIAAARKKKPKPMPQITMPAIHTTLIKQVADQAAARGQTPAQFMRSAAAVGLAPPPPTPHNPQGGRTIFGIPVLDVGIGAVVLTAGAAVVAHVKGWF
jgi:hypothetical protein